MRTIRKIEKNMKRLLFLASLVAATLLAGCSGKGCPGPERNLVVSGGGAADLRLGMTSRYTVFGSGDYEAVSSDPSVATVAVDGDILPAQAGGFVTLNRDWQDGDELLLTLPMAVRKLPAFHQAVSIARGPIRFVYAPKTVAHDDVLSAGMDFAVALVGAEEIRVIERMDGSVALSARVTPLPRWGMRAASCDQPPIVLSDANIALAFDAELVPYAEAAIRLAVLPVL